MLDQTYSKDSLQKYFRKIRVNGMTVNRRNRIISELEKVSKEIKSRSYKFESIKSFQRKGKNYYKVNSDIELIVVRYTNHLLKRVFKVKQSDRNFITKCVYTNLTNSFNQVVIRTDISNFYESIPYEETLDKIKEDNLLSSHAKYILSEIFSVTKDKGVPRGISISSTLSEIYFKKYDELISTIPGVLYYGRYVDDIVIFGTNDVNVNVNIIKNYLPQNLNLNSQKTKLINIDCRCVKSCICGGNNCRCKSRCKCKPLNDKRKSIEYLGYDYSFSDVSYDKNFSFDVIQRISKSKVNKMKTRITLSLRDYIKTENFYLLRNRIKFITSNYLVYSDNPNSTLRAGIFYNYNQVNEDSSLKELDRYLHRAIYASKGRFGKELSSKLDANQKKGLIKYSFMSGFNDRRVVTLSGIEIGDIKRCWYNE